MKGIHTGILILAAGASSRMGRPKLLLPWGNTTILGHQLARWQALGAGQLAVVHAAADAVVPAELDRLRHPAEWRIQNPAPERGMFSSIQCAARWDGWKAELSHVAITLGDQPHLRQATLRRLLEFAAERPDRICQPRNRAGRPRHPVVLPRAIFRQLADGEMATLKAFLHAREGARAFCDLPDAELDFDIDTPEDYERALKEFPPP